MSIEFVRAFFAEKEPDIAVICLNQHICCQGHPEHVGQHPEYLQLFGKQIADGIAVYTHHHDHDHDLHGNVHKGCAHD